MLSTTSTFCRVPRLARTLRTSASMTKEGIPPPGDNLPFSISGRYALTAKFAIFVSTGFGLPFLMAKKKLLSNRA